METDIYLTLDECAARFRVKRITIKRWIAKRGFPRGKIPGEVKEVTSSSKFGEEYKRHHNGRVLYPKVEVDDWDAKLPREPIPVIPDQDDE